MVGVLKALFIASGAIGLALCVAPVAAQQAATPDLTLERLEPQTLEVGECGMFLWSRANEPELMLVAWDKPGLARFRANGRVYSLPRVAFSGESANGHFERQRYSDGGVTVHLDVSFDRERQLRDGAYVRDGVMRVTSRRGWETVAPVGGMTACQREAPVQTKGRRR